MASASASIERSKNEISFAKETWLFCFENVLNEFLYVRRNTAESFYLGQPAWRRPLYDAVCIEQHGANCWTARIHDTCSTRRVRPTAAPSNRLYKPNAATHLSICWAWLPTCACGPSIRPQHDLPEDRCFCIRVRVSIISESNGQLAFDLFVSIPRVRMDPYVVAKQQCVLLMPASEFPHMNVSSSPTRPLAEVAFRFLGIVPPPIISEGL